MTQERANEVLSQASDEFLIDVATTCSNRGVALNAEMWLRRNNPSPSAAKKLRKRVSGVTKSTNKRKIADMEAKQ